MAPMLGIFTFAWPIAVSLIAGFVALRLFGVLSPCVILNTDVTDTDGDAVVVRIEVSNVSRVTIRKSKVLFVIRWIQADDVALGSAGHEGVISEWVDFSSAEEILVSTETLYAGETIIVERAYRTNDARFIQTGLQFFSATTRFQRRVMFIWPRTLRWTTTRIHILAPGRQGSEGQPAGRVSRVPVQQSASGRGVV